jgi:deazaflavin-dependent oxidoreductase (nitroreductase family)
VTDFNQALIAELRSNHGQVTSGPFTGRRLLILTTTGAKTGQRRETPLVYSTDGDRFVIVASKGGAPSHPAWYHNIAADSAVTVEVDGERFAATATIAGSTERRRLYDAHAALYPTFAEYEARTDRVIPVIVLQREAASVAA